MGDIIPIRKYDANAAPLIGDYWGSNSFDLLALLEAVERNKSDNETVNKPTT